MKKGLRAYLYLANTVVIEKSDIDNNPPDENFRQIMLYIDEKHIREWHKELEMMTEIEGQLDFDEEEEDW